MVWHAPTVLPTTTQQWSLTFRAVCEPVPGPQWRGLFARTWPAYRTWYCRPDGRRRPDLETCARMLQTHMPELVPGWRRLVRQAGGDELAARMLSLYDPPPYLTGCSQAVLAHGRRGPSLVRNYDYAPQLFEGTLTGSSLTGRKVVGMSDCLWGLVDGMNDAGLAVSLAFGGRPVVGHGFGIPLVLRYVLEVCDTVTDARAVLARVPVHMAYTVTAVDRGGGHLTAYLGPDREPGFTDLPLATNHQERPDWPEQAEATRSVPRHDALRAALAEPGLDSDTLVGHFLRPPLRTTDYSLGFGTVYTARYRPRDGWCEYRWPGSVWRHRVGAMHPGRHVVIVDGR